MRMLVEPEAERPLTPAAATPSFKMQSAAGAELARRRREAMSARPTPGYVRKRPQSAPMYRIKGCGETRLPGGHFNKSGAHKEMFRLTYLDEAG